jgi:hypothetical protein
MIGVDQSLGRAWRGGVECGALSGLGDLFGIFLGRCPRLSHLGPFGAFEGLRRL